VYRTPVRKKNLQALLTGTLATTVHVGPLRFCEVFLKDNTYPSEQQQQLKEVMGEMLLLAKVGVQINAGLISSEQVPFQEMLEDKLQSAMTFFQQHFAGSLRWNEISSTIEEKAKLLQQQANDLERKLKQ